LDELIALAIIVGIPLLIVILWGYYKAKKSPPPE
jgi:hypothetical protein